MLTVSYPKEGKSNSTLVRKKKKKKSCILWQNGKIAVNRDRREAEKNAEWKMINAMVSILQMKACSKRINASRNRQAGGSRCCAIIHILSFVPSLGTPGI